MTRFTFWHKYPQVLACILLAAAIALFSTWQISKANLSEKIDRFFELSQLVVHNTNERLRLYTLGLRGTRGAITAVGPDQMTRQRFRHYIESRDLPREFPGAAGFGFIRRVPRTEEITFLQQVRAEGLVDFKVRQLHPHDGDRFIIQYVEPEATNAAALGLDIASEENRQKAARMAEENDTVTLTGPITLVQKSGRTDGGLLFLLPVFKDPIAPTTLEGRKGAAIGWAYAPILVADVIGGQNEYSAYYTVHIEDVTDPQQPKKAFESEKFKASSTHDLVNVIDAPTFGRQWRYEIQATEAFVDSLRQYTPSRVGITIFIFELLLIALYFAYLKGREQDRQARKHREQLASIVESSGDAIIGKKLDGTVMSWNHAAEEMFGYSRTEAVGKTLTSLIIPENQIEEEIRILQRLAKGEMIPHFETIRRRKDGSRLHVSASVAPILDERGVVVGASKTVRDITRQKEAENNVHMLNATLEVQVEERTRELNLALNIANQASKSKAEFLTNISHEIRSPMNAVLGLAYLLEQNNADTYTRDLAKKITQAGKTLLGIINDVLDLSKIEQGRLELEVTTFSLPQVIDDLATIMGAIGGSKNLEIVISPLPAEVTFIQGDPLRLEQVLINLLNNAIKFTEKGHVILSVRVVQVHGLRIKLRFTVQDTGIGISSDKQESIFSPFTQADSSTTRKYGGTGLGLTICRQLVELMDGEIGVVSVLDHGSEFWFTAEFERAEAPRNVAPSQLTNLNVLVADDNKIVLEALKRTSEQLGWRTTAVDGGLCVLKHTIERATNQPLPDVLILDWEMPDLDGLTVTRTIREGLKDEDPPIVVMVTAYSREQLEHNPNAKCADVLLSKPVTASSLYDAVAAAMYRRGKLLSATTVPNVIHKRLSGLRLLVVDDSEINRDLAKHIFTGEGAEVFTADDGQKAVDILSSSAHRFDLILMDVQMPVMDGLVATSHIRHIEHCADIPVVALTAGAFNTQREAALSAGMNVVITKPFNVDRTIATILELVYKNQPLTPPDSTNIAKESTQKTNHSDQLPGIEISKGMGIWNDEAVYKQYLYRFMRDYQNFISILSDLAPIQACPSLHKLKGASASLGLSDISVCAGHLEARMNSNEVFEQEIAALNKALTIAFSSIKKYAATDANEKSSLPPTALDKIGRTLEKIEYELNSDNPNNVWLLLKECENHLGPEKLIKLRELVEIFDFRGAESELKQLRETLKMRVN